jgi:beta-lactamase class A
MQRLAIYLRNILSQPATIGCILLFIGAVIGWESHTLWSKPNDQSFDTTAFREGHNTASFINPLLLCDASEKKEFAEFAPIEQKITKLIDQKISEDAASRVSVYFRDLNEGRWVGINENETFSPASLLKVPIMISYFKLAESTPEILEKKILYKEAENLNAKEDMPPQQPIKSGTVYSVMDLIRAMIVDSDNNAAFVLFDILDRNSFREVGSDLGITIPEVAQSPEAMSAKTYARFFRILYNSSYISRTMSEQALKLMSQATFTQGLAAGIPDTVPIAHKFGEERCAIMAL